MRWTSFSCVTSDPQSLLSDPLQVAVCLYFYEQYCLLVDELAKRSLSRALGRSHLAEM